MESFVRSALAARTLPTLLGVLLCALYFLARSADCLVESASALSRRWGISEALLGATLVSLGTTTPEAAVSVYAALCGNADLALGNAIGSIVVDTGFILGLGALLARPGLALDTHLMRRHARVQLFVVCALGWVTLPRFGARVHQYVGWLFLSLLALYLWVSLRWSALPHAPDTLTAALPADKTDTRSVCRLLLQLGGGIGFLVLGSRVLIPTVEIMALRAGVPAGIIAATIIAFGTSVPELVSAITAVRRGHGALAVGNIVGADILNVLFVVGAAASLTPHGLPVPKIFSLLHLPAMLLVVGIFHACALGRRTLTRPAGVLLCAVYGLFVLLNGLLRGTGP